jgi:type I restriction enzyme S subunit
LGDFAKSLEYGVTAAATLEPVGPKFLRITDIQDGAVNWDTVPWCECDARSVGDSRLRAGDIVFARTGATTGKSFLIRDCPPDTVFASYLIRVRVGNEADPRYVSHFFKTRDYWAQITKGTRGVAQPGVNATTLRAIQVPLPPVAEQKKIADVLERAEALRSGRRAAMSQLDTLAEAVFLDLFGDPLGGDSKWQVDSIEKIAANEKHSIVDGPFGSSIKSEDYRESGVPLIRIANITKDGYFLAQNLLYVSKSKFESLKRSSVRANDLLVSRVGTIGNVCIFPDGVGDALLSTTGVCKITVNSERMLPIFLHQAMRMHSFQAQIQKSASTSVQKYFNLTALKGWKIIVPPLDRQCKFARRVAAVEKLKVVHRASLAELHALFATLQHRAFRGQL